MEGQDMRQTKRATWMILLPMALLGGIHGPGCFAEEDNTDRNGEAAGRKGDAAPAADDGDPCTAEGCDGQANAHVVVAGLPCGANNALICRPDGKCGGCTAPDQCGQANVCAPWSCDSGVCNPT